MEDVVFVGVELGVGAGICDGGGDLAVDAGDAGVAEGADVIGLACGGVESFVEDIHLLVGVGAGLAVGEAGLGVLSRDVVADTVCHGGIDGAGGVVCKIGVDEGGLLTFGDEVVHADVEIIFLGIIGKLIDEGHVCRAVGGGLFAAPFSGVFRFDGGEIIRDELLILVSQGGVAGGAGGGGHPGKLVVEAAAFAGVVDAGAEAEGVADELDLNGGADGGGDVSIADDVEAHLALAEFIDVGLRSIHCEGAGVGVDDRRAADVEAVDGQIGRCGSVLVVELEADGVGAVGVGGGVAGEIEGRGVDIWIGGADGEGGIFAGDGECHVRGDGIGSRAVGIDGEGDLAAGGGDLDVGAEISVAGECPIGSGGGAVAALDEGVSVDGLRE